MTNDSKSSKKKLFCLPMNIALAVGLLLVVIGIILLVVFSPNTVFGINILRPILVFMLSVIILYYTLMKRNSGWLFFAGIFLFQVGILYLLIDFHVISYTLNYVWPIFVINGGISFFIMGLYRFRRIKIRFLLPSSIIILLGILFLLFSMDVIKHSFLSIFIRWWPSVLVLAGICLVVAYVLFSKHIMPIEMSEDDDEDDFSDIKDEDSE